MVQGAIRTHFAAFGSFNSNWDGVQIGGKGCLCRRTPNRTLLLSRDVIPTICEVSPVLVHQHQLILLGSLVREFEGEFGRGWLSRGNSHDGSDDIDQI